MTPLGGHSRPPAGRFHQAEEAEKGGGSGGGKRRKVVHGEGAPPSWCSKESLRQSSGGQSRDALAAWEKDPPAREGLLRSPIPKPERTGHHSKPHGAPGAPLPKSAGGQDAGAAYPVAADQPRRVNGVLGGSVVLSASQAGSGPALLIALFRDGKFDRPDPSDRFEERIEMFNETLRIKPLELNDSGVFGARVKIFPALVEDQLFQLMVYEPVLTPRIQSQLISSTPSGCNVTLQCLSPGKGRVNVTWRKGNPIQDLGSTDRYQVSPDGRTLRLSLQPTSLNTTYSCMASNPIEHKIVYFDLQRICQSGVDTSFSKSGYMVLTIVLLVLSLGTAFWCWRINSEKSAQAATIPTVQVEESPSDAQNSEVPKKSPPEVPRSPGK
ncbi:PREDICTED: leucine-rich repeats and immunoglobulin-like domains protein 1 [Gekko japonicus]|uniref:leucine-rich repeats and immunoglobulin-like domains protein 1 n=1 Tax=Gekko japonicus TaxID=146911 RepID=UPI00074FCE4E|nr:PREDICTED: leucine-rich repeats and immunoglobulin-like domains protein 1 [Gekko japonicus]